MFSIFPKDDYAQTLRIKRFLMAFTAYCIWCYISVFTFFLGLTPVPLYVLLGCFSGILVCNISIYAMIRTGFNKRFNDPSLTLLQMMIAIFWVTVVFYYAESVRSGMLLLYLVVFVFGLFRLNVREFLFLSLCAIAAYSAVVFLIYQNHPQSINAKIEVLHLVIMATVLPWFSLIGGYITNLKSKISRSLSTIEQNQQELQALMDVSPIAISWSDMQGNVQYNNRKFIDLFGYTVEDMPTIDAWRLLAYPDPAYRDKIPSLFGLLTEAQKQGKKANPIIEAIITCKDGSTRNVIQAGALTTNRILITFDDITEYKQTKEQLWMEKEFRQSNEKYRNILENMQEGYFETDLAGNYTFLNEASCRIHGYPMEELMGMNNRQYTEKEIAKKVFKAFNGVYKTGEPLNEIAWQITRKDGAKRYVEASVSLMKDEFGKPIGFRGIIHDITERKQSEELLKQSEAQYALLSDHIKDYVWIMDLNLNWTYISPSGEKLLGYTLHDLKQIPLDKLLTASSLQVVLEAFSSEMSKAMAAPLPPDYKITLELEACCKDGRIIWIEGTFSFIQDENGNPLSILCEGREISQRKHTEDKLYQTLESLRKAVGTTINVLVSALEARDPYTAGHQSRAADLARAIATEMGLPHDKIEGLRMAGIIHDIGKLSIPAEILSKPTKLTNLEFSMIKEHSQSGYEMLKHVESPWPLAQIVHQHHERINGTGYPRNLKGDEIIIEARILSVADVVEAMASHRPYRASLGIEVALEEIEKNKGILYDETVADACLKLFREKGYKLK